LNKPTQPPFTHSHSDIDLAAIFDTYGPVKKTRLVVDPATAKSRGYGFVEFEHTSDFKRCYKEADGLRIAAPREASDKSGAREVATRRAIVDYERGRTVASWLPRRLGGGKGPPRPQPVSKKAVRDEGLIRRAQMARSMLAPRGAPPPPRFVSQDTFSSHYFSFPFFSFLFFFPPVYRYCLCVCVFSCAFIHSTCWGQKRSRTLAQKKKKMRT
jgi:RNA recognition motif-containing protein